LRGEDRKELKACQKEVLIYTSHCRHMRLLFQRRGCDFDMIDTTDDAELCELG
jgi:hypothetical protein